MTDDLTRRICDPVALPSRVKGKRSSMASLTAPGSDRRAVPAISRLVPAADFPPLPTLSFGAFLPTTSPAIHSVLDAGAAVHVTAGRFAIALALKAIGVNAGEQVLMPAYHCMTMVEPLTYTAATPVFYRLDENLAPDLDDIAAKIDQKTRVLMVAHYFGFPQDMRRIRSFCDARGLKLLEDCAHAYFGSVDGRPVGTFGDLAIASPTKFFPLNDGGCLILKQVDVDDIRLRRQGALASVAAAVGEFQRADYYGNLPIINPFISFARFLRDAWRRRYGRDSTRREASTMSDCGEASGAAADASSDFDPTRVTVAMSGYSYWIYRHVARSRIIAKRRENYLQMIDELRGVEGCRPLRPDLPDGVVPYEVPFLIDELDRVFPLLEDMAVPMHRFGQFLHADMPVGTCPHSEKLSHQLVQFPCHQDLTETDIRRIADRIRTAFSNARTV